MLLGSINIKKKLKKKKKKKKKEEENCIRLAVTKMGNIFSAAFR